MGALTSICWDYATDHGLLVNVMLENWSVRDWAHLAMTCAPARAWVSAHLAGLSRDAMQRLCATPVEPVRLPDIRNKRFFECDCSSEKETCMTAAHEPFIAGKQAPVWFWLYLQKKGHHRRRHYDMHLRRSVVTKYRFTHNLRARPHATAYNHWRPLVFHWAVLDAPLTLWAARWIKPEQDRARDERQAKRAKRH